MVLRVDIPLAAWCLLAIVVPALLHSKDFKTIRLRSGSCVDHRRNFLLKRARVGIVICWWRQGKDPLKFHFVLLVQSDQRRSKVARRCAVWMRCIEVLNAFVGKDNKDPPICHPNAYMIRWCELRETMPPLFMPLKQAQWELVQEEEIEDGSICWLLNCRWGGRKLS